MVIGSVISGFCKQAIHRLSGSQRGFGILMAATIGVPLYVCGGGAVPLLIRRLADGMSPGGTSASMITGPAARITNLEALKIALGTKHFAMHLAFVVVFHDSQECLLI